LPTAQAELKSFVANAASILADGYLSSGGARTVGKVLMGKKFAQRYLLSFTANMPRSQIGLEAS
jgi:hypothetical protein